MRLVTLLLALTAIAFASSTLSGEVSGSATYTLPETDDIHDSYAFTEDECLETCPGSFSDYAVCDDLSLGGSTVIYGYTHWGVTTGACPVSLELLVMLDSSGTPAGAPVSQETYPCDFTNTGFTFASYPIYMIEMDLGDLYIAASTWIGARRNDSNSWYPMCGSTVSGSEAYRTTAAGWDWEPLSKTMESGDIFRIIEGFPIPSVGRTTWAGIKSGF
ncbi:MAG: hypothetical protein KAH31_01700 [Candidatus Sabulitectum sp.]|nr:hypothetical protein [Candidatus Sabulitectum sp.]